MNTNGRTLREVADGVWVTSAVIWTTTSTVVVDDDGGALVIDPAVTVAEVEGLAAEIAARGWQVTGGYATHPHWDHALWSASLGDVPRWATAPAVAHLGRDVERARSEATRLAPGHDLGYFATLTPLPRGATTLPWDGNPAIVEHDAHAPGHGALVTRGVMLAGDMLSDTEVPLIDENAPDPVATYRFALDRLERAVASHAVEVLVPGHGTPAVGRDAITDRLAVDRAYLDALDRLASTARTAEPSEVDPRATGYVAEWHAEQLTALRGRREA